MILVVFYVSDFVFAIEVVIMFYAINLDWIGAKILFSYMYFVLLLHIHDLGSSIYSDKFHIRIPYTKQ